MAVASRNRRSRKEAHVLDTLRARISRGELQPGLRLPTRREIERQFKVSSVTVQRALDRLSRDGFIRTEHRQGMFVADQPPSLCRYALVFPGRPEPEFAPSLYWQAMAQAAQEIERASGIEIVVHYDVVGRTHGTRDFDELVAAVLAERVAGLIFAHTPHQLVDTPVFRGREIPRVAMMSEPQVPGVATLSFDYAAQLDLIFDHLLARGRRRVAMLCSPMGHVSDEREKMMSMFAAAAQRRGVPIPQHRMQGVPLGVPWCTRHAVQGLVRPGSDGERPDALVILEDNLTAEVQRGLIAAGVRVPEDVEIVTHCNFPCPPPSILPMTRIGYDARRIMRMCVSLIDAARRGRAMPRQTYIRASTEAQAAERVEGGRSSEFAETAETALVSS